MDCHRSRIQFEQLELRNLLAIDASLVDQAQIVHAAAAPSALPADQLTTVTPITTISGAGTDATLKDPQSKVWQHGGVWWSVLDTNAGTALYRLDGTTWTQTILLSGSFYNADVLPVGNGDVTYALLYSSSQVKLAKFTFVSGNYQLTPLISPSTPLAPVPITANSDTATIAIDTTGRMWMASDTLNTIEVRYADAPYTAWSSPIALGTTSSTVREVSAIVAFGGKIGVMWSDHSTHRFGFRYHIDGDNPSTFSANEVPASQSAINIGNGMSDDHISIKAAADGTLYAAVKTAYDLTIKAYPEMALLVRRPNGAWDPLYGIDAHGTRPIVEVNDTAQFVRYIYAGSTGINDIVYKDIPFAEIDSSNPDKFYSGQDFPSSLYPRQTLIAGGLSKNPSSSVQSFNGELVVVATNAASSPEAGPYSLTGAKMVDPPQLPNQPPVNSVPGEQTILEDVARVFSAANGNAISVTDPDGSTGNERVILSITGGTATIGTTNLTVVGNGTSYVAATGTLANINAALNGLVFTPTANLNGVAAAAIRVDTSDLGSNGGGGARTDSDNIVINVTSVNDAPSFTKGGGDTVLEDSGPRTIVAWATNIKAGPTNEAAQTLAFTVTNSNNSLFFAQPTLTPTGTLTYTPAANASGSATVSVFLKDNGGIVNGGVDTSATITFTINVTAVNDQPSFVAGSDVVVLETSATQYFTNWATAISAGPANEASQSLTFTLTNDNNALFTSQPKVGSDGTLSFKPTSNAYGTANVTISLKDSGGTANGGIDSTATQTFVITVVNINDVPKFTAGADQVVLEDAPPQTFAGWATGITAGPNEASQSLNFVVSNNNNSLFFVQPSISPSGTLTYTLAPNANGAATVSVYLHDDGGTANGGVDVSSTKTFKITATSVNDAPLFTKGPNQSVSDTAGSQSVPNWATGIAAGPANEATQSVSFSVTNDNNGLFNVQPAVSANGTLTYTVTPGVSGTASVSVQLTDNGGTASGGVNVSAVQTFTISVVGTLNLPPVNSVPGAQNIWEDTPLVFSTAGGNAISVSDPDAGNADVQVTLAANGGTILIGTSNLVVSGNGMGLVTATGSLSAINQAINGLIFTPTANLNGAAAASLSIATDDLGNTGAGGNCVDNDSITINITSVNDAPSFSKGSNQSVLNNAGAQTVANWASAISAGAPDESAQLLTFTVTNDSNGLFDVQPAIAVSGTLTFTPKNGSQGTAVVSVTLRDNGGVQNGGQDTSATQTFLIAVNSGTPSNSAPVLNNSGAAKLRAIPSGTAPNGGTLVSDIIASVAPIQMITDADSGAVQGIAIVSVDATQGNWEYSLDGGNWSPVLDISGAARLLAADATTRVRFLPNANSSGTVANAITFRAWDRTSGSNGGLGDASSNGGSTAFSSSTETASILVTGTYAVRAGQQNSTLPSDEGRAIVVDPSGNAFVTGSLFYADGVSDSSSTNSGDIFVARFDASGSQIWQVTIGSTGDDRGRSIARDAAGNLYITGMFQGTVDFDPGAGITSLTSQGGFDMFVLKLDANGVFQWAKAFGSNTTTPDGGFGIAVDMAGDVLVTGQFGGTVDFGAAGALASAGGADIIVLKLAGNNGSTIWARRIGASGIDTGNAITTDASGQVYVTGSFRSTTDFDPGPGTFNLQSNGNDDVFVLRLTSAGNLSMAVNMGGSTAEEAFAIAVDAAGNIITTGDFSGTADFDPGAGTAILTSAGVSDIFVSKIFAAGAFVFAKQIGGTGDDRGRGVAALSDGSLAITGHYTDTVDFDPGAATASLVSAGANDSFVLRLSSTGSYLAARSLGGTGVDLGRAVTVDQYDDLYLTGQFSATMNVDTGAGVFALTSVKGKDVYVAKMHPALLATGSGGGSLMTQSAASPQLANRSQGGPSGDTTLLDVNLDGEVTPLDVLLVVNALNSGTGGPLPTSFNGVSSTLDVTSDGLVSPLDALAIVNQLNAAAASQAASGSTAAQVSASAAAADVAFAIAISPTASDVTDNRVVAEPSADSSAVVIEREDGSVASACAAPATQLVEAAFADDHWELATGVDSDLEFAWISAAL